MFNNIVEALIAKIQINKELSKEFPIETHEEAWIFSELNELLQSTLSEVNFYIIENFQKDMFVLKREDAIKLAKYLKLSSSNIRNCSVSDDLYEFNLIRFEGEELISTIVSFDGKGSLSECVPYDKRFLND